MAGNLVKKDYYDCLNRIAICKNSKDYTHLHKIIDEYYELRADRMEMLDYMRKQCTRLEKWSKVAKASDYMRWFLGPFYHSKKNSAS